MPPRRAPLRSAPSTRALRSVRRSILAWYDAGHRDFPWRQTRDPYAVLVSEVMLQQTQASRVAVAFGRFMASFPNAAALAAAPSSAVLAAWNGLGYNRRALALQRAAGEVTRHGWPRRVEELERLPGVGRYTARAVASLAFGEPVGVVDTNVRRWLVRRFGLEGSSARPTALQQLADRLAAPAADGPEAARWTHAGMELGARICRSRRPDCEACPIASACPARGAAAPVAVRRPAEWRGSRRAYRGALVRLLTDAPSHRLSLAAMARALAARAGHIGPELDREALERLIDGLVRDGLVSRSRRCVQLGSAAVGATATIGP